MRLRALAPAKVNLALFLGPARDDGRHELVTVLESISLADELLLETLEDTPGAPDEVECPGIEEPNLITRALASLRARGWHGPPVRIEVRKKIPVAAGLGGGSADAACALRMAIKLAPGRPEEVMDVAAALGADVPSQVAPGLSLGTGAGEVVEAFGPLAPHALLVLPLPHALATGDVYAEADRLGPTRTREELDTQYAACLRALPASARLPDELIVNDLEPAAVSLCPQISEGIEAARGAGAEHALVCGSGPTVAGLFWGADGVARATAAAESLAGRFPGVASAVPVSAEFGLPLFA